jgi:hypothetical protein
MKTAVPGQADTEWVNEIYVGVFPVALPGSTATAETILAGYQQDPEHPQFERVRATVETHLSAVPDLIEMCDKIVEQQEEIRSFRLLKFDRTGVQELDPDDFRFPEETAEGALSIGAWGRLA